MREELFVVRKAVVKTSHSMRHDALYATFAIQTRLGVTAIQGNRQPIIDWLHEDTKSKKGKMPHAHRHAAPCLLSAVASSAFRRAKHHPFGSIMAQNTNVL